VDKPYLSIQAIQIFVRDQDRSLRFYVDQLGFTLAFDARLSGSRWVAVAPPDGTAVLALIAPEQGSKEYELIGRNTQVAFVAENVLAKYDEWRKRGVRFQYTPRLRRVRYEPHVAPAGSDSRGDEPIWGGVFTRFKDVDGNSFGLMGFDTTTRHIEAQRRAAAEKLEAERRAAQELEIAKQVQARLFPQTAPALNTLEYAGSCIQARQVGGDYYDFIDLGRERMGLVIGDIAGKGIAAALLMANLQANLRSQCATALDDLGRFMWSVNQLFCDNTTDSAYATLFFAEYDDTARRLRFINCGHLSALVLRRDNTLERLESTSTVLGLFKDWECSIGGCQLQPGDLLALYTDGITESSNERGDEFGEHGLTAALRQNREVSPQTAVAAIIDEVRRFSAHEQHDDITLIVGKCTDRSD
jgi:serine phosphatase RsbU (regulator of sigma subunit)/predicted enzyme related to lactoylglutathione lyase